MQDFDLIETPENVELEQRLAGIGSRFIAGLVDHLIVAGALLALGFGFFMVCLVIPGLGDLPKQAGAWALAVILVAVYLLHWGYFVFWEMKTNGQSLGKIAVKIRVVREGGGPITFTDIAIRNLLRAVDMIGGYAVAGLAMFFSRKVQRLGDLAAGTVVISEQTPSYSARPDRRHASDWEQMMTPEALRATGLDPEAFRVLANFWARRHELTLEARRRLLGKLVSPILERTGVTLPDHSPETLERYVELLMGKASGSRLQAPGGDPDT